MVLDQLSPTAPCTQHPHRAALEGALNVAVLQRCLNEIFGVTRPCTRFGDRSPASAGRRTVSFLGDAVH
jgi:hypothetical protein